MRTTQLGRTLLGLTLFWGACATHCPAAELVDVVRESRRILFLGDSITYAGGTVAGFETWLAVQPWPRKPHVISAGLPSETVSGLSEEGHAGGQFPRPVLSERLERILAKAKPDLILACYGMNDGIYLPFDEARFAKYQAGIEQLRERAAAVKATVIHLTPPAYDDQRGKLAFSYNDVLGRYAAWLLSQRDAGWLVIDLHGPMTAALAARRQTEPDFTFQPDAVHPTDAGLWFLTQTIVTALGDPSIQTDDSPPAFLTRHKVAPETAAIIQKRMALLRDAYLSGAGHQRPGIKAGVPIADAEAATAQLTRQIEQAVKAAKP
jgi:lysophospholipase L1-like esterase